MTEDQIKDHFVSKINVWCDEGIQAEKRALQMFISIGKEGNSLEKEIGPKKFRSAVNKYFVRSMHTMKQYQRLARNEPLISDCATKTEALKVIGHSGSPRQAEVNFKAKVGRAVNKAFGKMQNDHDTMLTVLKSEGTQKDADDVLEEIGYLAKEVNHIYNSLT